jgi:hypothetical protein
MRLKSTTEFPPGSFQFLQPQTGWNAIPGSFDSVVRQVIGHRAGNKAITKQYNLATDYPTVSIEVDEFNAHRCVAAGWNGFVIEAPPPSFRAPTLFRKLSQNVVGAGARKIVAGVKAVALWLGDGLKPVPQELAELRASVCAVCPKNGDPNFIERLSAIGAEEIKTMMAIRGDMALKTKHDAKLNVCTACSCYLKLKVFCPLDHITSTMSAEIRSKLAPACWIKLESEALVKNETQPSVL